MKLLSLQIENIKKIKRVEINFDEENNLVMVSGRNAQGKSTVLDAIWWALGGKNAIKSQKPLREGTKKGKIVVETDTYIITRRFTESNTSLTVSSKDGADYKSPQQLLDKIYSELTIDPLEFSRLSAKEQKNVLLELVGVDLDALEQKDKELRAHRQLVGRDLKNAQENYRSIPEPTEELSDTIINIAALSDEYRKASEINTRIESAKQRKSELTEQIEMLQQSLDETEHFLSTHEPQPVFQIKQKLSEAEETNQKIEQNNRRKELGQKGKEIKKKYESFTKQIEDVETTKSRLLEEAEMPIAGLSVDDNGVVFNGIAFEDLSSAEKLKVSSAVLMATNPELRVFTIKDGSLLDSTSLAVLEEMTKGEDYVVLIETVDETGTVGIVIEDGEIVSDNR